MKMAARAETIDKTNQRPATRLHRGWTGAVVAASVGAFFFYFAGPALRVRFALDEPMNMYRCWQPGLWQVIWANLTFSNSVIRPMGVLYYLPLFQLFGFNPLPFNVVRLAILSLNTAIFYFLAARITNSRGIAALAAFPVAYHAGMANLSYVGSFIYDVLCGGFYFSALLYYLRCRDLYGRLNPGRSAVFLALYVCALNSKEMAVSLPVVLFAYELLYPGPRRWKRLAGSGPLIAAIAITVVFIGVKTFGPGSLTAAPEFRPVYTWQRFFETNINYLNEIFYTRQFTAGLVVLLWAALLCLAAQIRDRRLLLLSAWVVVTPLPIAFLSGRGGACLYIVVAGWSMAAAILVEAAARRIAQAPLIRQLPSRAVVIAGMAAFLALYGYQTRWLNHWVQAAYLKDGYKTATLIEQFQRLPARPAPGSRVLFLNDPFPGMDTFYVASLWWDDPNLKIYLQSTETRQRQIPEYRDRFVAPDQAATMDYVFDFPEGRLAQRKP